MKVILANPRGFCAGVNMAVESLDRAPRPLRPARLCLPRNRPQPPYRRAIPGQGRRLRRRYLRSARRRHRPLQRPRRRPGHPQAIRGAKAPGHRRHLPARHQGPPRSGQVCERGLSHSPRRPRRARRSCRNHRRRPRTISLWWKPSKTWRHLPFPKDAKLAYLTQTTLSVDEANVILNALKARYPQIVGPNKDDICYATQNRQEAVRELVPDADVVLVLGSQNSSNSKRLEEIARDRGRRAHLIDRADGKLNPAWFNGRPTRY